LIKGVEVMWRKEKEPEMEIRGEVILYWEVVENEGYRTPHFLIRAKVPGGWLVKTGSGLTFLPDPNHEWK
jgi:hypothetical protein